MKDIKTTDAPSEPLALGYFLRPFRVLEGSGGLLPLHLWRNV